MSTFPFPIYIGNGRIKNSSQLSQREGNITSIKVSRLVKVLHLFFVSDIIIATRADPRECREIKSILNFFYRASRLQINESKSTFHYSGLQVADIENFKIIFFVLLP